MADSGKSERIERLEQQVNQRVRQAISGLHEEIRDRLRRAGDQIVSELDRELEGVAPDLPASFLSREELEPLTAEADIAGRHRALGDLVTALAAVDGARSQASVLDALVREAASFAPRIAVLLARDSGLDLWGTQGWAEGASGVQVAWADDGPWSQDTLGRGVARLETADCAALCSQLEEALPAAAVLVPLVVLDRLGAVVYADTGDGGEVLTEALQVLTWAAALALETLPFRNREATPTLSSGDSAGAALGVWSAPAVTADEAEAEEVPLEMESAEAEAEEPMAEEAVAEEAVAEEEVAAGWTREETPEAPQAEVGELEVGEPEVIEETEIPEVPSADLEADELELSDDAVLDEVELDDADVDSADLEEGGVDEAEETQAEPPRVAGFEAPDYGGEEPADELPADELEVEDLEVDDLDGDLGDVDLYSDEVDGDLYAGDQEGAPETAEGDDEEPAVESGFGASPATAAVPVEEAEPAEPEVPATVSAPPSFDAPAVAASAVEPPAAEPTPPAPPPPSAAGGQVAPPQDLQGPGTAFAGDTPSGEQDARHEEARRLARLLVSEIRLYNEEEVEEGRRSHDIYQRLKEDIDRSRQMYEERIDPGIREETDYFYEELVRNLGDGDARTLGL